MVCCCVSDGNDCSRTLLEEVESCSVSPWIPVVHFTSDTWNDCLICGSVDELWFIERNSASIRRTDELEWRAGGIPPSQHDCFTR